MTYITYTDDEMEIVKSGIEVTAHSPVSLRFPVCSGWLMRGFQFKFRG